MSTVPVKVTGISVCAPHQGYVVILKEEDGKKYLPIFIGAAEAHNISLLLQGLKYIRPLTYDLFHSLLEASDAKVENVTITELRDNTFFAEVLLNTKDNDARRIDARPSDAVALAIKTRSPIFVSESVMSEAGLEGDEQPIPDIKISLDEMIEKLRLQLKEAVETEAYEEAAKIRDQIKDIEER